MTESNAGAHWHEEAAQERARLLAALGHMTEGGIVEEIQHIGATSVLGLPATPPLDLALAVAPFPLTPEAHQALDALGYVAGSAQPDEPEQRYHHVTGAFQLFVCEAGSAEWVSHLLIRDYLRSDEAARQRYTAYKEAWSQTAGGEVIAAKTALFAELVAAAQPWWIHTHGFGPVQAVAQELEGYERLWYIASGWALDLYLGRVTRVHQDVDVVIPRSDQLALREYMAARGWQFVTPLNGNLELWPAHMRLELPRHQAHAHRDGQFIDFLLTDISGGIWRYRRDPVIIRTLQRAGLRSHQGIPYLAPELVLLFKSRNTGTRERTKDQADFEQVAPHLDPEPRAWLRWALTAANPAHPWIAQLV